VVPRLAASRYTASAAGCSQRTAYEKQNSGARVAYLTFGPRI